MENVKDLACNEPFFNFINWGENQENIHRKTNSLTDLKKIWNLFNSIKSRCEKPQSPPTVEQYMKNIEYFLSKEGQNESKKREEKDVLLKKEFINNLKYLSCTKTTLESDLIKQLEYFEKEGHLAWISIPYLMAQMFVNEVNKEDKRLNKQDKKKLEFVKFIYLFIEKHQPCSKKDIANESVCPESKVKQYLMEMTKTLIPYITTIGKGPATKYITAKHSISLTFLEKPTVYFSPIKIDNQDIYYNLPDYYSENSSIEYYVQMALIESLIVFGNRTILYPPRKNYTFNKGKKVNYHKQKKLRL